MLFSSPSSPSQKSNCFFFGATKMTLLEHEANRTTKNCISAEKIKKKKTKRYRRTANEIYRNAIILWLNWNFWHDEIEFGDFFLRFSLNFESAMHSFSRATIPHPSITKYGRRTHTHTHTRVNPSDTNVRTASPLRIKWHFVYVRSYESSMFSVLVRLIHEWIQIELCPVNWKSSLKAVQPCWSCSLWHHNQTRYKQTLWMLPLSSMMWENQITIVKSWR